VRKVIGAGANGIIFLTYQGCVVKVAFSTYHHSDYYKTEDGDIRSKTLDQIIKLGLTSLTGYEILVKEHYLVVHEYHALQSYTLNELLTYTSTSSFIKNCLVQLVNIVVKLHNKGLMHDDLKPINIMVTEEEEQIKKKRQRCSDSEADDEETKFIMVAVDVGSIDNRLRFSPKQTTPPYSVTFLGPSGNAIYMMLATMISCLCHPSRYPQVFHVGGLDVLPMFVKNFLKESDSLTTLTNKLEILLGYKQSQEVIEMLVALLYTIALNSCDSHPKKKEYVEFVARILPELAPFL
jgi:serine/threonine protein kinase